MSETHDMSLPAGLTCDDCYAFRFCNGIGCTKPGATRCDYYPVRFHLSSKATREPVALRKAQKELAV